MPRAAALALLLVGCSGANTVPTDFGADAVKVGEWDKGREVWARIDKVTHVEGVLWIYFAVANKSGIERNVPAASIEVTVKDHKGGTARGADHLLAKIRPGEQAEMSSRVEVSRTTFASMAKWAAVVTLAGKPFGEDRDFRFLIRSEQ